MLPILYTVIVMVCSPATCDLRIEEHAKVSRVFQISTQCPKLPKGFTAKVIVAVEGIDA